MSLESDLFTALSTLVAGRVYPDLAPQGVQAPYIVYQQVGGAAPAFVERAVPAIRNARMQVAVWSTTRAEANSIIQQAGDALVTCTAFQARPLGAPASVYEPDTLLYGSRQDFTIWVQL